MMNEVKTLIEPATYKGEIRLKPQKDIPPQSLCPERKARAMRFALGLAAGRNHLDMLTHYRLRAEANKSLQSKVDQGKVVDLTQNREEVRN